MKELLKEKIKISKKDLIGIRNTDKDLHNLIKYNFENIVKESSKEWSAFKYEGEDSRRCALCNTKNKYIFLIRNKINEKVLNVGSECIKKFDGIESSIEGVSIDQIKRNRIKEIDKITRTNEFNEKYPDIINILEKWKEDYNNLQIVIPRYENNELNEILSNSRKFYNDYTNGKILKRKINDFGKYISNHKKLMSKIDQFIEKHKDDEFICKKELRDWLINNNLKGIYESIINDGGYITEKTIKYIYYFPFVEKYIPKLKSVFEDFNFSLEKFNENDVVFSYRFNGLYKIYFNITLKDFMKEFGQIAIEEKLDMNIEDIIKVFSIIQSEENYNNITNIINTEIYKHRYHAEVYLRKNELEIDNNANRKYCSLRADLFFKTSISCLLAKEEQKSIIQVIKGIQNWKDISEREKFNTDKLEYMMKSTR